MIIDWIAKSTFSDSNFHFLFIITISITTDMVLLSFLTITEGEQYLITNHTGTSKVVEGPCRITLFRSQKQKLTRYVANDDEYLEVKQTDGKKSVLPGPCSM